MKTLFKYGIDAVEKWNKLGALFHSSSCISSGPRAFLYYCMAVEQLELAGSSNLPSSLHIWAFLPLGWYKGDLGKAQHEFRVVVGQAIDHTFDTLLTDHT